MNKAKNEIEATSAPRLISLAGLLATASRAGKLLALNLCGTAFGSSGKGQAFLSRRLTVQS
jgi:hypothetical protein